MKLSRLTRFATIGLFGASMVGLSCLPTLAEDLSIALDAEISAADPHVLLGVNRNVGQNVFEPLLMTDENQKPLPGLALSWKIVEPTVWEFKLRPDVKFHDGSPFTAEDVKFSFERASSLTGPRTFRTYLSDIAGIDVVDPLTIRVRTKEPMAILLENLATFGMISKKSSENATEADFNGGKAAIGTGPYRWVKWVPGDNVKLQRFNDYWGGKAHYENVTYRFIKNDSTRVASLLSGDVKVISAVPPALIHRLQSQKGVDVTQMTSYMLNYFGIDRHHKVPLHIKGPNGETLESNPLNDRRVREALSIAINRDLIAKRVMDNTAAPAGQIVPKGMTGHVEGMNAPAFNPARAKELLAEAGFPKGFQLTIHCTNDRYPGDAQVCEAVGQMFSAIGIKTKVETLPGTVFFERATSGGPEKEPEFSFFMVGFGAANGVADAGLKALFETYDKKAGKGANNRGRYSNPEIDRLMQEAGKELDQAKRMSLLEKATRMAMEDVAVVPVHFIGGVWATRDGLKLTPRSDQFTLVRNITPKK